MTFRYHQLQITLKSVELKSFQAKKLLEDTQNDIKKILNACENVQKN